MATMHEHLDDSYSAVFVKMKGSVLVPLGYRGIGAQQLLLPNDPMVEQCWAEMEPVRASSRPATARPGTGWCCRCGSGNRMIGVAVSSSATVARARRRRRR